VDIFETVCCGRGGGNERATWHQGTARLYTPVRRRRHRLTCVAAQRLRHRIHQQKLNTQNRSQVTNFTETQTLLNHEHF